MPSTFFHVKCCHFREQRGNYCTPSPTSSGAWCTRHDRRPQEQENSAKHVVQEVAGKQVQDNLEIRHKVVLAENPVKHVVSRRSEAIADQDTRDLQRKLMLEMAQARQSASETHNVLVQAVCRVHAAEEMTEHFAIESVNVYRHAV
jgi:hypothetical protein